MSQVTEFNDNCALIQDTKDAWFSERQGKFTASEIHKIMPIKNPKGNEFFSSGAWTYIEKKAIETVTVFYENPALEYVKSLRFGKDLEQTAFDAYCKATGVSSMRYFGTEQPIFLTLDKDSGGSPDGIMGNGLDIQVGLELKCPLNSANHWAYWKYKNQWDLKDNSPEYYAQVQMLLMITKSPVWHWVSFDERFKEPRKRIKLIEVEKDQIFQDNLEIRLMQAVKERDKMIKDFLNI